MENYFDISFEFDKTNILSLIDQQIKKNIPCYICVGDEIVISTVYRKLGYRRIVNESLFSICDSRLIPLCLKWIYGINREQYNGREIFIDLIRQKKYRMFFMGTSQPTLQGLSYNLSLTDDRINGMTFYELSFRDVEDFNYPEIAQLIEEDGADIIWIALGAPKQEVFMNRLKPHLKRGVMIAVGATFKYYSGTETRGAQWANMMHLKYLYEPKKLLKQCGWILYMLPRLLYSEWKRRLLSRQQ